MKRYLKLFLLILFPCVLFGQSNPVLATGEALTISGKVSDHAETLDTEDESYIREVFQEVKNKTGINMYLVTVSSVEPKEIEDCVLATYQYYDLGGQEESSLLMVVSVDDQTSSSMSTKEIDLKKYDLELTNHYEEMKRNEAIITYVEDIGDACISFATAEGQRQIETSVFANSFLPVLIGFLLVGGIVIIAIIGHSFVREHFNRKSFVLVLRKGEFHRLHVHSYDFNDPNSYLLKSQNANIVKVLKDGYVYGMDEGVCHLYFKHRGENSYDAMKIKVVPDRKKHSIRKKEQDSNVHISK